MSKIKNVFFGKTETKKEKKEDVISLDEVLSIVPDKSEECDVKTYGIFYKDKKYHVVETSVWMSHLLAGESKLLPKSYDTEIVAIQALNKCLAEQSKISRKKRGK